jgi:hypothetical protein
MTQQQSIAFYPATDLAHASNIRHEVSDKDLSEMKASILARNGVLQNLIAAPRKSDSKLAVFAGGTRLAAAKELIEEGNLDADFTLPVMVRSDIDPDSPEAIEMAMTENMVRSSMNYMDECNAMFMLSASGRTDDDIAAAFGYRSRTVKERLLIANLTPEAQALVRDKERDMEWGRAMTIADKAMQNKICDDIAANSNAWKTSDDIRKYLTKSTIPCTHAIFDAEDYDGIIVSDFFEGDNYADVDKFWALQNEAVSARLADMEAEGFGRGVQVIHEPFEDWRYEDTTEMSEASAFIEVMPDGKVREIRGKKAITADGSAAEGSLSAHDHETNMEIFSSDIAPFEVRATPRVCEFASAHRTAMLQARLAGDFRASLEYTVLAFLGQRTASFGATPFHLPGKDAIKTGHAFDARVDVIHSINELTEFSADESDISIREAMQVSIIRQMDDENLQKLFSLLVSQRVGQQTRNALDGIETNLSNIFGNDINIRDYWSPNAAFFEMMSSEDLRRLATEFLPGATATRFANSKPKNLVRALSDAFQQAEDGVIQNSLAERFNSWVPGVMSFPARVATADELYNEASVDENDLEASIFGTIEDDIEA